KTTITYFHHPIFEPFLQIHTEKTTAYLSKEEIWWIVFLAYLCVIVPLQELIVRGGLQSTLEAFLAEKHVTLKAIIVSNFLFSTTHLFLGIQISLLVFVGGIYFGWIYSRCHTLIGAIIAHAILGIWTM